NEINSRFLFIVTPLPLIAASRLDSVPSPTTITGVRIEVSFFFYYSPLKAATLSHSISCLCFSGKVQDALHFHDHVVAHEFHLNQVSYGTLINGLCKIGETKAAMQVLRQIEGKLVKPCVGVCPDVVTYTSLTYGFCIVGQLKEAIGLLNEMVYSSPSHTNYGVLSSAIPPAVLQALLTGNKVVGNKAYPETDRVVD
ncbi:pentatricopeptide repeat-containing protein, partial [Trifolium medium]|nr:pentatricopeptide repeat-containing protein [Trifolium medium]